MNPSRSLIDVTKAVMSQEHDLQEGEAEIGLTMCYVRLSIGDFVAFSVRCALETRWMTADGKAVNLRCALESV